MLPIGVKRWFFSCLVLSCFPFLFSHFIPSLLSSCHLLSRLPLSPLLFSSLLLVFSLTPPLSKFLASCLPLHSSVCYSSPFALLSPLGLFFYSSPFSALFTSHLPLLVFSLISITFLFHPLIHFIDSSYSFPLLSFSVQPMR